MAIMCLLQVALLSVTIDPSDETPYVSTAQKNNSIAPPIAYHHSTPVKSFQAMSNDFGFFNKASYLLNRYWLFIVYYLFVFPTHPSRSPRGWKNSIQNSTENAGVEMLICDIKKNIIREGFCGRSGTDNDLAHSSVHIPLRTPSHHFGLNILENILENSYSKLKLKFPLFWKCGNFNFSIFLCKLENSLKYPRFQQHYNNEPRMSRGKLFIKDFILTLGDSPAAYARVKN